MEMLKLNHANLELYPHAWRCRRWYLPVCSALCKEELQKLNPSNPTCWEDTDIDGCPTICYVFTDKAVRDMNKARTFMTFFALLKGYLGERPLHRFFYDLWLKDHNLKAISRNKWGCGGSRSSRSSAGYHSQSVRNSASRSLY